MNISETWWTYLNCESEKKKQAKMPPKKQDAAERQNLLVHQRTKIQGRVAKINNTLEQAEDGDSAPVPPSMLKVFAAKLDAFYKEYTVLHREVLSITPLDELEVQDDELDAFELLHTDTLDRLERLTAALSKPASASNAGEPRVVIQQPLRAPIPSFDGKVDN